VNRVLGAIAVLMTIVAAVVAFHSYFATSTDLDEAKTEYRTMAVGLKKGVYGNTLRIRQETVERGISEQNRRIDDLEFKIKQEGRAPTPDEEQRLRYLKRDRGRWELQRDRILKELSAEGGPK
jgi:hypothetical protein